MRAAVVEQPPQDVFMGRDCPELKELLKEALESSKKLLWLPNSKLSKKKKKKS